MWGSAAVCVPQCWTCRATLKLRPCAADSVAVSPCDKTNALRVRKRNAGLRAAKRQRPWATTLSLSCWRAQARIRATRRPHALERLPRPAALALRPNGTRRALAARALFARFEAGGLGGVGRTWRRYFNHAPVLKNAECREFCAHHSYTLASNVTLYVSDPETFGVFPTKKLPNPDAGLNVMLPDSGGLQQ